MGATGNRGGASVVGYDSACHDLAELFLEEENHEAADVARLAQRIQDAIEDYFFELEYERREQNANAEGESAKCGCRKE